MNNQIKYLVLGLSLLTTVSCKTNLKEEAINSGNANFTRFVAVGNSLTSGYTDGALSRTGQMNSFPKMLSEQFQLVAPSMFNIPYMNEGAGNDGEGNPRRILDYVTACNASVKSLSPIFDPAGATAFNNIAAQGPYHLVGVPGIKAIQANSPLGSLFNPFLQRFCQAPGTSTLITEAMRANPTFFTLWLGNNDVLLYATSGAVDEPVTSIFSTYLSDPDSVYKNITQAVDSLTKYGAKGAIANIPNVTSIPFFTTIPWNGVVLTQGQADTLNGLYASYSLPITWSAGANGMMIVDSSIALAPYFMRHATSSDYILLTTPGDSLKCGQWGVNPAKPLKDQYVLDTKEVATIQSYTNNYNISIAGIASKYNLALVNINSYFNTFVSGIKYNGINMNAKFISGGAFSLDGVHPNARGYALLANEFIKSINAKYNSTIPQVDVTKYKGIIFP